MKRILLLLSFCVTINMAAFAQGNVPDTHPTATIFAIDYSTGQETQVNYDAAILFKNALIELVSNTTVARMQMARMVPGRKTFVVTQMDPQTNGNAYQLVLQSQFLNRNTPIYTFIYSVDQNVLSYLDAQSGRYVAVPVQGGNLTNLNNCANYGMFNAPPPPAPVNSPPQAVAANTPDTAPIDADVAVNDAPPALPDYEQPECPVDGYLWQPGYWAYGRDVAGYYWVPGAWVAPPQTGLLWTPPYWGFDNGRYVFHGGYWGPTIGFYGGLNYGFGYYGVGFAGGAWRGNVFSYNTAVVRVNTVVIRNVYADRSVVVVRDAGMRASFNGRGGIMARPNDRELAAMRERHVMATPEQIRNQRAAREDRNQFAAANGGRPANVASPRALEPRPGPQGGQGLNNAGRPQNNGNPNNNNGQPNNNSGRQQMNNGNQNYNNAQPNNNSGRPQNNGNPNYNNAQPNNNGGRPQMNNGNQNNNVAQPGDNGARPQMNNGNPNNNNGQPNNNGGRPQMNNGNPNYNNGQSGNAGGRPNNGAATPNNTAAPANNAIGNPGARPTGNAAPNTTAPAANANGQPGNRPANGTPPQSVPATPGAKPAQTYGRPGMPQQPRPQKTPPPPPEKKPNN